MRLRGMAMLVGAAAWLTGQPLAAEEPAASRPEPAVDVDASPDQIENWVAELDSSRYHVRERATQALIDAGPAGLDRLLAAANGDRPEPAHRAVWILQQLGESEDYELAAAALDRLVDVEGRTDVVEEARDTRQRLHELICQRKLTRLGGKMSIHEGALAEIGQVRIVQVELGPDWQGTAEDLRCLSTLDQHRMFRLEGSPVGDAEVALFAEMDNLTRLELIRTRVSPDAVDAIKRSQPAALVYMTNQALLGILGENHAPTGVLVKEVPGGTGAAHAGIVPGDVITMLDATTIPDFDRLTVHVAQREVGETVEVTLVRGDQELTKRVELGQRPAGP